MSRSSHTDMIAERWAMTTTLVALLPQSVVLLWLANRELWDLALLLGVGMAAHLVLQITRHAAVPAAERARARAHGVNVRQGRV